MIQDFTFIYLDFGHAKEDKTRENEAKKSGRRDGNEQKKWGSHPLDIIFTALIDRDYELIKRFNTATESLSDSQVV